MLLATFSARKDSRIATLDAPQHITTLTGDTFPSLVLNATQPIAVEFMSYGCSHCRAIEPVIEHVAETVLPREHVYRVNVAAEPELASRYAIDGTPTFVMFLNGREVGRSEGPRPNVESVLAAITQPFAS